MVVRRITYLITHTHILTSTHPSPPYIRIPYSDSSVPSYHHPCTHSPHLNSIITPSMLAVLCFVKLLLAFMHRVCGLGCITVCKLAVISRIAVRLQASRILRLSNLCGVTSKRARLATASHSTSTASSKSVSTCRPALKDLAGGDGAISIAIDGHPPHRVTHAWHTPYLQFTFSAMQAASSRELMYTTLQHRRPPP